MNNFLNLVNHQTDSFLSFISDKTNIIILSHSLPDGDAMGSSYSLGFALKALNKKVKVLCHDPFPKKFTNILGEFPNDNFNYPDAVITVDVSSPSLFGDSLAKYANKIDICIDHHKSTSKFAKYNIVYSFAASTCEIIYRMILRMGVQITQNIADCLYLGIITDTGCFLYPNVTENTFLTAAALVKYGARTAKLNKIIFNTKSLEVINLEHAVMSTLRFFIDNKCAIVTCSEIMKKRYPLKDTDVFKISHLPQTIEGVLIAITLEQRDDFYKVSLRTVDDIDASFLCSKFGGGGHLNAAGCKIRGNVNEIIHKLVKECELYLDEYFKNAK